MLDLDQLRTFVAIADSGSFTRAAEVVFKTQSAVSMQMRRLEERIGKPIFARDGRASKLTEEGERLLGYARRMVRLSDETIAAFDDTELIRQRSARHAGRLCRPLPARHSRPLRPLQSPRRGVGRLRPVVGADGPGRAAAISTSPSSPIAAMPGSRWSGRSPCSGSPPAPHSADEEDVLPLALSAPPCVWRSAAVDALTSIGRKYRILYSSRNSTAVAAAVLAGLAVTVLAESALRPGMRVLTEADGFPRLPTCEIGMIRSRTRPASPIVDALAEHICLVAEQSVGSFCRGLKAGGSIDFRLRAVSDAGLECASGARLSFGILFALPSCAANGLACSRAASGMKSAPTNSFPRR